jgi:hypothetical protein
MATADSVGPRTDPLLERNWPAVRRAVDDFEVAVLLETDGVTDGLAQVQFGVSSVFELAGVLRREAAVEQGVGSPPRRDWYPAAPVALMRGTIFTIVGLMTMTVVGLRADAPTAAAILVASVVGMAFMQSASFLAYMAIERCGKRPEPAVLRPFLRLLIVPVLAGLVLGLVDGPSTGGLLGVMLVYLVCMSLLLALGKAGLVGVVVLPAGVLALVSALELVPALDDRWILGVWGVGALALVASTVHATRAQRRSMVITFGLVDVRAALPFFVEGLAVGAVVLLNLWVVVGPALSGQGTRVWLAAALPFLVPVSFSELMVVTVRRRLLHATTTVASPTRFRHLAQRRCLVAWALFVAGSASMLVVSMGVTPGAGLREPLLTGLSFMLVGVLLTAGLLLLAADAVSLLTSLLAVTAIGLPLASRAPEPLEPAVLVLAAAAGTALVASVRATADVASYR